MAYKRPKGVGTKANDVVTPSKTGGGKQKPPPQTAKSKPAPRIGGKRVKANKSA